MLPKYGIPVFAILSLAFAAVSVARLRPVNKPAEPFAAPPSVTYLNKVGAVGLVEASSENISVSVPVPGMVTHVFVKPGDRVARGQKLFLLDDRDLRAELALRLSSLDLVKSRLARLEASPRPEEIPPAEARVAEMAAQVSDAQVQLDMIESVKDKRAIRTEDLERRKRGVQIAAAKLDEARTNLRLLKAGTWSPDLDVARAEVKQAASMVGAHGPIWSG